MNAKLFKTGTNQNAGTYSCTNCGTDVALSKDNSRLPPCPHCSNNFFTKE